MSWTQVHNFGTNRDMRGLIPNGSTQLWTKDDTYNEGYHWNGSTATKVDTIYGYNQIYWPFGSTMYTIYVTVSGGWNFWVYSYDGTPFNWTLRDSPGKDTLGLYGSFGMTTHGSHLLALYERINSPATVYCRYSTDGAVWNTDNPAGVTIGDSYGFVTTNGYMYQKYDKSGGGSYIYRRSPGGGWTQSGSYDMDGTPYHMIYSRGSLWPTDLFCYNSGTNLILYSNDEGDSWSSTGLTGGGSAATMFSWGIGSTPFTFLATNNNLYEWNRATHTFTLVDSLPTALNYAYGVAPWNGQLYCVVDDQYLYRNDSYVVSANEATLGGPAPTSMDVSADDYYLYIGVLDGASQPVVLRMLADLTADPVKVYEPGAGSAVGVVCGDWYESLVWIAGDFGVPKVRLSTDDGGSWTTKDPGTWNGTALPFCVGPAYWDEVVLVYTDGDDDLHETVDSGTNWTTLNAAMTWDLGAVTRLDLDFNEILVGGAAGGNDVEYSPNNGLEFVAIDDGFPASPVTDLIMG